MWNALGLFCLFVCDKIFLWHLSWPQTPNPPALVSQLLGLQAHGTMLGFILSFDKVVKCHQESVCTTVCANVRLSSFGRPSLSPWWPFLRYPHYQPMYRPLLASKVNLLQAQEASCHSPSLCPSHPLLRCLSVVVSVDLTCVDHLSLFLFTLFLCHCHLYHLFPRHCFAFSHFLHCYGFRVFCLGCTLCELILNVLIGLSDSSDSV